MSEGPTYSIFLSYRRSDSGGYAGWLHQLLVERFPDDEVFRDVDAVQGGERWVDRLDATLSRCNVVVAVIGPDWLTSTNEKGRRLDDPEDRVRLELEAGIRRGVPLIPALVGGARMPESEDLPPSLVPLHEWQAIRLSDESWQHDVEQLVGAIERSREAAPGELQLGIEFASHHIEGLIGRGGMGVVYRGRHLGLNRVDAVKVIAPDLARGRAFRERFVRESQLAASVRHENVVTVYDAGEENGLLYLTMQLVDGYDLASLLARDGPVSPQLAIEILVPVAGGLQAAHDIGLVHRDVKPGNILMEERAGRRRVYLGDFGLAREKSSSTGLTSTGHWIGTADYVSPEQVMGDPVDGRADVYALGCVLFEVLSGRVVYPGRSETAKLVAHATKEPPSLAELRPDVPSGFDAVVRTAMARDPGDRYPSAASFGEALTAAGPAAPAAAGPARARPPEPEPEPAVPTPAEPSPPTSRRLPGARPEKTSRRSRLIAGAAAALVAVGLVVVIAAGGSRSNQIAVGKSPVGIAVGQDAAWVTNRGDNTVTRIDPILGKLVGKPITVGSAPVGIAVGGGDVWVANSGANTVTRIAAKSGRVLGITAVGKRPIGVVVAQGSVWVTNSGGNTVTRIDASTGRVLGGPIKVGSNPTLIAADQLGIWVSDSGSGAVTEIAPQSSNVRTRQISVVPPGARGANPLGIAAQNGTVWVADSANGVVTRIDASSGRVLGRTQIPGTVALGSLEVTIGQSYVWVANETTDAVTRIDPNSGAALAPIHVGHQPEGIAIQDLAVLVANTGGNSVTRILESSGRILNNGDASL